jgi:hypothetical protein
MPTAITHDLFGEALTIADLAELAGVTTSAMHVRLRRMPALAAALMPRVSRDVEMLDERFGKLVVEREVGKTAAGKRTFECLCDCGNRTTVVGADLRSGCTGSCGCARAEATSAARIRDAEDLTGKPFADDWINVLGPGEFALVAKGPGERRRIRLWRCECRCGKVFQTKAAQLRAGQTTSCGCRKKVHMAARWKEQAPRYDFFGERLTLSEIAEASGAEGPTISYRMQHLGMTPEQAALSAPQRRYQQRPGPRRVHVKLCRRCRQPGHNARGCKAEQRPAEAA